MDIIINSEVERLTNEINNLKEELLQLLDEKHELIYVTCPKLKAKYYKNFGVLETEVALYEAQVKTLRLKLELIRQKTNRGEAPDLTEINKQVELQTTAPVMELAAAEGEAAMQILDDIVNEADILPDNEELKKLYKKIAVALHPDLHPEYTEKENRLFLDAIEAYKNGDIDTVRLIEAVTRTVVTDRNDDGAVDDKEEEDAAAELRQQRGYIAYGIDTVRAEIAAIKNDFPYNTKSVLDDPEQTKQVQERLATALADYRSLYNSYRDDLEKLMKEYGSE